MLKAMDVPDEEAGDVHPGGRLSARDQKTASTP